MALNNLYAAYERYNINPNKNKKEGLITKNINNVNKLNKGLNNNVTSQYLENKVMTAPPEILTLMLYEGAIKFSNIAIKSINEGNNEKAHNAIIRVQDIIDELMCTLDMKIELSNNLYQLYQYIINRLVEANVGKDASIIEETLVFIKDLKNTWKEAIGLSKKK